MKTMKEIEVVAMENSHARGNYVTPVSRVIPVEAQVLNPNSPGGYGTSGEDTDPDKGTGQDDLSVKESIF